VISGMGGYIGKRACSYWLKRDGPGSDRGEIQSGKEGTIVGFCLDSAEGMGSWTNAVLRHADMTHTVVALSNLRLLDVITDAEEF